MRIVLLAYSCHPGHGSEPEAGWNWAHRLSERHEVHLVTHPHNRVKLEAELAGRPRPALSVTYAELPRIFEPDPGTWRQQGALLRYSLWQLPAFLAARRICRAERVDLVHHVSWSTVDGPTLGWALGRPFVWGPVGGAQRAPRQLHRFLGAGRRAERVRDLRVVAAGLNPFARLAARSAAVTLACNEETAGLVRRLGARDVRLMPPVGVDPAWAPASPPERADRSEPVVLWMGRLDYRKAAPLAIEAFARASRRHGASMWIAGDGHQRPAIEALAAALGVADRVRFLGRVPLGDLARTMREADVFLFTSLRDTFPEGLVQAMACGLPSVSLDHQGVRLLPADAVRKVPIGPPEAVVAGLADALVEMFTAPALRRRMGLAAWRSARSEHLWPRRVEEMERAYAAALGPAATRPVEAAAGRPAATGPSLPT